MISGMFSIGKTNPERNTIGIRKKNAAVISACCSVAEMVEINRPRPSVVSRYTAAIANRSRTLPRSGTWNQSTVTPITRQTSIIPTIAYGRSLPTMISQRRSGVTFSCSSVPRSRSRTMPIAARIVVTASSSSASTPGSMK